MNSKKLEIFSKYKKERRGNKLKFKKFLTLRFFFWLWKEKLLKMIKDDSLKIWWGDNDKQGYLN